MTMIKWLTRFYLLDHRNVFSAMIDFGAFLAKDFNLGSLLLRRNRRSRFFNLQAVSVSMKLCNCIETIFSHIESWKSNEEQFDSFPQLKHFLLYRVS